MDKSALVSKIIAQLDHELALYERSARAAHAEATDEQSKAENKYDTRGLEASYLARGQSRQMAETLQAREHYATLPLRDFGPADPIDIGAVIAVEFDGERTIYFIGPRAGGMEISHEDETVLVITPQSPLGQQIVGQKPSAGLKIALGGRGRTCRVETIA